MIKKALLVFESELDTLTRNKSGIKPIVPFLNKIDKINSLKDLQEVYCKNIGISNPFIGLGANPDLNNSSVNIGWIYPGGLGLQRDYYVDNDEKTIEIRKNILHTYLRCFNLLIFLLIMPILQLREY